MASLKLGKMTNKELADWFDISIKTFTNAKKKKLEELKNFADFYEDKGKVYITEIYEKDYSKRLNKNAELVHDRYLEYWGNSKINSVSNVSKRMNKDLIEETDYNGSLKTTYNQVTEARNRDYGSPSKGNGGLKGYCYYKLAPEDPVTGAGRELTPEEEKIKNEIYKMYYASDIKDSAMIVKGLVQVNEVSKENAWDAFEYLTGLDDDKRYIDFINALNLALGCKVKRFTVLADDVAGCIDEIKK